MLVSFPLPYYVTAAGYVDRYGPEERYNVLGHLAAMRQPTLVTFGSAELANAAFAGLPEAIDALVAQPGFIDGLVALLAKHLVVRIDWADADPDRAGRCAVSGRFVRQPHLRWSRRLRSAWRAIPRRTPSTSWN